MTLQLLRSHRRPHDNAELRRTTHDRAPSHNAPARKSDALHFFDARGICIDAMPPLNALLTSLLDLACAERRKVILPLVDHPSEMVLERDGDTLYVSHYTLDNPPELYHWDQAIHYRELLDFSIEALQQSIDTSSTPQQDKALIDRAFNTVIAPDIEGRPHAVVFRANTQANSKVRVQGLEFGFTASVRPSVDKRAQDIDFSDLHALLFQGSMWVWFQGKRIPLIKGPIALAVQHMLRLADRIVDHWMHGRPGNYSFCTHNLRMGMRLNPQGHVELKFSDAQHTHLRIPSMQIRDVVLPLVRLAAAMTRSLVRVDQQQRRNLYVRELRDLMRSLRRRVMTDPAQEGFTNQNPNRLQALRHAQDKPDSTSALNASTSTLPALQFEARWSAEIDGLDIGSTFYCGDRFIIRHADMLSALSSDTGQTLWSRPCGPITVIGQTLLDLSHPEHIELCDIKQGESFARIDARAPTNCQQTLLSVNSPHIPPTCLLLTQDHHCIAFDLRHGQMRWRLRHYHHAQLHAACSGRVVVMAADHHTLIALDALQGDILWRFSARAQFTSTPVIFDDTVVVFSGDIGHANCRAIGIDLLSGAARWECELKAPRTSAALAMNDCVLCTQLLKPPSLKTK